MLTDLILFKQLYTILNIQYIIFCFSCQQALLFLPGISAYLSFGESSLPPCQSRDLDGDGSDPISGLDIWPGPYRND